MRMPSLILKIFVTCAAGCGNEEPVSPTSASAAPTAYVVSGTLFEIADGVSRSVAGRSVDLYVSGTTCVSGQGTPCIPEKAAVIDTDQNGRYAAEVTVLPKTIVFVTGAGLHGIGQQPCVASAPIDRDTTIDIQIFPTGGSVTPPPAAGPIITGFVYQTTSQGRHPLRGVWAWLEVGSGDSYLVSRVQTNDAGRFFFCRVEAPVRMVVSGYREMVESGYRDGVAYIPGTADMSFEIELHR